MYRPKLIAAMLVLGCGVVAASSADAACCFFVARRPTVAEAALDISQPAQKVFITWDPVKKTETFTVQPKFEGDALDFGMVIPTPSQPKLHEMPRDFFKHLAVYSILKKREMPESKLLPRRSLLIKGPRLPVTSPPLYELGMLMKAPEPTVKVLEVGVVGSLDYKIIEASRADDLFQW